MDAPVIPAGASFIVWMKERMKDEIVETFRKEEQEDLPR